MVTTFFSSSKVKTFYLLFFTSVLTGYAQENKFLIAEKYLPKNQTIVHTPIQTSFWVFKDAIIVFYSEKIIYKYQQTEYEHNAVYGYLLLKNGDHYTKVLIDSYEDDNVDTEILSVFFANVDNDKEKELVILTSNEHKLRYLYEGTEYGIYFYDNISINTIPTELKPIYRKNLERFQGNFEGFKADKKWTSKFKTADDIKKELKKMGY